MTFEALLETSVEALEAMSDSELLEHLAPTLKNHPPIELALIQKQELLEKEEKDKKKALLKLEKDLAKPAKVVTTTTTKAKVKSSPATLAAMNQMLEQMKQSMLKAATANTKT